MVCTLYLRFLLYHTIFNLMENSDVMINPFTKNVLAKPSVWERIVMVDERVKWYAYEGEKAYDDLEVIFENPWKGKEDFIHLGKVTSLHKVPARFDEVELAPLQCIKCDQRVALT